MDIDQYDSMMQQDQQQYDDFNSMFPPGTSEEEITALYNDPELFERYIQEMQVQYSQLQRNYSVYDECAVPVVTQSFHQMWHILFYCLILRCLLKLKVHHCLIHILSIVFGCVCMWKFYGRQMVYVVAPTLFFLPFFQLRTMYRGSVVCFVTTIYLVACEFSLLDSIDWNKVKGSVMIVLMKAISVIFEMENGVVEVPSNSLEFYSYVFNPASVIFGPFITYKNYMQMFKAHSMDVKWFISSLWTITLSIVCLLWSSCCISNYLPKLTTYVPVLQDNNKWWMAYQEAQSFRFSHYFISYFSESSCLVSGIGTLKVDDTNKKKDDTNPGKDNKKKEGDTTPGKDDKDTIGKDTETSKDGYTVNSWYAHQI